MAEGSGLPMDIINDDMNDDSDNFDGSGSGGGLGGSDTARSGHAINVGGVGNGDNDNQRKTVTTHGSGNGAANIKRISSEGIFSFTIIVMAGWSVVLNRRVGWWV